MLVQTLWSSAIGRSRPDLVHPFVDVVVNHVTRQEHEAGARTAHGDDVTELLPSVETETLIIHREESIAPSALGRRLAAGLSNARLLAIDGDSIVPFIGNGDLVLETIREKGHSRIPVYD